LHILPKRFVKFIIFLSSTWSVKAKAFTRETSSESIGKVEKKPFTQMSLLQNRNLHRIAVFDQRGPPAWYPVAKV
jgi:hypothetical protein